ncbi:MAG TPA: sulfur oxidation c-type cytochrome SoxA [Burkholderiales bacterium]|nr:sulfur oxidation c-type cytochrome SoxA [Burkholderiales bacterium]
MPSRDALRLAAIVLTAAAGAAGGAEPQRPSPLKSGSEFVSQDLRRLQADDFANPGMLWVTRGAKLWSEPAGNGGQSCAACHGDAAKSMKGVAARYPRVDPAAARLVNLEDRINLCRERNQRAAPLERESGDLLALAAHVAHQSRGMPGAVSLDPQSRPGFERGRTLYETRIGQMNLACAHCHDRSWGKSLLGETISQGHGNAYPAYRLEWQSVGSLQRRIRACYYGLRAEMPPYGAQDLLDLELYLAVRAGGLPIETPGVRR